MLTRAGMTGRGSRSRSSSKSTSSHSSKANTSAVSLPSSSKQLKNINNLSVNKLFGDKYKRNPNTKLTIIDGVEGNHFRKLEVNNSRAIMEEVIAMYGIPTEFMQPAKCRTILKWVMIYYTLSCQTVFRFPLDINLMRKAH